MIPSTCIKSDLYLSLWKRYWQIFGESKDHVARGEEAVISAASVDESMYLSAVEATDPVAQHPDQEAKSGSIPEGPEAPLAATSVVDPEDQYGNDDSGSLSSCGRSEGGEDSCSSWVWMCLAAGSCEFDPDRLPSHWTQLGSGSTRSGSICSGGHPSMDLFSEPWRLSAFEVCG